MRDKQLAHAIEDLASTDPETRHQAIREIADLGREGLTLGEGWQALTAAARDWPKVDQTDPSEALVTAALSHPCEDYLEFIIESFPHFSSNARRCLLGALVDSANERTARGYLTIFERYREKGIVPPTRLAGFAESAEASRVLLPDLLQQSGADELGYQIQLLALRAAEEGRITRGGLAPFASRALDLFRPMRERMRASEEQANTDWIWSEEYGADRPHATLLLDLMGFLPGEAILEALEESLTSRDPRVQHFALLSLIRHGREVTASAIEAVAASPEMRNWFYDGLALLDRLELFPDLFATQEAFAESNMVDWLTFPTELGCAPHVIELMATFENESCDQRYYLFRFRMHPPHWAADDGWMAGLSGPFEIAAMPTTQAGGSTFSTFTNWESKTPHEHFESISGLIAEHWRLRAGETGGGDGDR